jgi:hypothetical protein
MEAPLDEKAAGKLYHLYLDERKLLIDAARESARTFDRAVLLVATGVFGFSVAFIKEIAPNPSKDSQVWLVLAWCFFALCITSILFLSLTSQQACMREISLFDDALPHLLAGESDFKGGTNRWRGWTTRLNFVSLAILLLGMCFLAAFSFQNLNRGEVAVNGVSAPEASNSCTPPPIPKSPPQQPVPSEATSTPTRSLAPQK